MDLDTLKITNKNIPSVIEKIYVLNLYDNLNVYLKGIKKLICLKYNCYLIISDDMTHLSITDTIENLTNIAKVLCHKSENILKMSYFINEDFYYYLDNLYKEDIIDIFSSFCNIYIDPSKLNLCQYHHVIEYFLIYEKIMPPKMFNFFNTLIPENDRINDIINIPNIISYFSLMNMYPPTLIINNEVISKINKISKKE